MNTLGSSSIGKRLARTGAAIFVVLLLFGLLVLPIALARGQTDPAEPQASTQTQTTLPPTHPPLARAQGWLSASWRKIAGQDDADSLLSRAVNQARAAGSHVIDIDLAQSVTPEDPFGLHSKEEWAQFQVRGEIDGPAQARFRISPQRASFGLDAAAGQEVLVHDDAVYEARKDAGGERWSRIDGAPATLGLDRTGLTLLDAASEVKRLEPVEGLPLLGGALKRSYQRVGFKLQAEDILRLTLAQQGVLSPENLARARAGAPQIMGEGELWIDASGYPARLVLDMNWRQVEDRAYRVRVHTETDYSHFGERFPPGRFDPAALPSTGLPGPAAGLLHGLGAGLWVAGGLALFGLVWLLARSFRGSRRAFKTVSALLVVVLVAPLFANVAQAAIGERKPAATQQESESGQATRMMADLRSMRERMAGEDPNPANALVDDEDEDGDGLPNGYEIHYGASPFSVDTDFDGINDYDEINGVTCQGQNQSLVIKTNPMMPDSNQDGLTDGEERHRGKCGDSYLFGWAWDDDNDHDQVPDSLDLSPFSASRLKTGYMGGFWQTPNFTFDTLDQNPADEITTPYPFYVELQIRPYKVDSLRWAYKTLFWPEDDEAAIRVDDPVVAQLKEIFHNNNTGTTGEVKLVPLLQATLRQRDLPTAKAMQVYGVSAALHKDADGNPVSENGEALWDMVIPLMTVERGGQVFAFQAKMLHDRRGGNSSLTRHWRDVRLKWAVVADVAMLDDNGIPQASPNNGYGLWVYDEAFELTGMQVSRQGGASMLLATALPSNQPYDDGPISLLRGGLEVQFLGGALTLAEVKSRFDTPNNATNEQRWGIPQTTQFRVVYNPSFQHMDEAIATTTMTTTKQVLENEFFTSTNLKPTFVYASEQRTSTVNLDEDPPQDYLDISINTCLKPLYTTRSLKLQTYQNVVDDDDLFGHWEPMSLDQVLAKVENDYAATTDPNDPYYEEELLIFKMATTAWQLGVTAIYKIGEMAFTDINDVLTDPELVFAFQNEDGVLLTQFKDVLNQLLKIFVAGGPVAWLQQQWTTVVEYFDKADHFFRGSYLDMANKTPDSYIKVIPQGQQPGGSQAPPGEPIDLTILSVTQTAITVLGLIAMWYEWQNGPSDTPGVKEFGQVLEILTKLLQIYQKVRQIIDMIRTAINVADKAKDVATAAAGVAKEVSSLARPLAIVGLIFAIAVLWVAVLVNLGDLGPSVALAVVVRAIVETVLMVVLFVVALIYPVGTIVAIAIGLIKLIESLIGFQFDPISLLLSWLFDVEAVQRTDLDGDPQFGELKFIPNELGAGIVSGSSFRLQLPAKAKMKTVHDGTGNDLSQSYTQLHVGRFADWPQGDPSISTPSKDLFDKYKEAVGGYYTDEFHAAAAHIIYFDMYNTFGFNAGHKESKGAVVSSGNTKKRTDDIVGYADVYPATGINQKLVLDISLDIRIRYDQCSNAGGCDAYLSTSTSPPAFTEFWFDILPIDLDNMWEWEDLANYDPDADGISGYKIGNNVYGPDANLCPNLAGVKTWEEWDSDSDGLSDFFEKTTKGFNPCDNDTDNDGMDDEWELVIGTFPDDNDTDNDGLKDKEEVPYDNGFNLVMPWLVNMEQLYPGLPNPPAYPNPRQANYDYDHRNDKMEKAKLSSPTSFDPVPVGDPLSIGIGQGFEVGKGQVFNLTSATWENDEAVALNATLTITLPVTLNNVTQQARLQPPSFVPQLNNGALVATGSPNVYRWQLPPLSKGRFMQIKLTGSPQNRTDPAIINAALEYDEGGVHQVSLAQADLLVNSGGPVVTFTNVQGAIVLEGLNVAGAQSGLDDSTVATHAPFFAQGGGLVTVYGLAEDPDRVASVLVCVKSSDSCGGADWKYASMGAGVGGGAWSFSFDPPADGVYFVRAYGIDTWGLAGQAAGPLKIGVDQTAPVQVSFDLGDTAFVAASSLPGEQPSIVLSGQVQDAVLAQAEAAGYVSGVGTASILLDQDAQTVDVAQPGQPASPFSLRWTPPPGDSVRTPTGDYRLILGATDVAGNPSPMSDTLKLVIDNLAPVVYSQPPQTVGSSVINLSGLADDTALVGDRQSPNPFATAQTTAHAETQFTVPGIGKAVMVGDVSGDQIDDVVVLFPATGGLIPIAFRAGLFFGRPGGLPASLTIANADVLFNGETPFTPNATIGPSAAGVGDVNGDGADDLLVGDPAADSGKGRAYLILGRRSGWTTPVSLANAAWKLSVANTSAFGGSVERAGDVNGDGLNDILVGAASMPGASAPAWLYLGREQNAPAGPKTQFTPPGAATASPPNLAGLGDSNGDGLSDFLIAARNTPAALVLGRTTDAWPANMALSSQAAAHFSSGGLQTVAYVGDVNADGLADLLLGSPDIETPSVYLVYGRRAEAPWPVPPAAFNLAAQADASFVGARGSRLGLGLTGLGDVDRDGQADFAFGQPGSGSGPNRTALVLTSFTGLARNLPVDAATQFINGAANSQRLGEYLSSGDASADHIPDLLAGAPGESKAYLFLGDFDPGGVAGVNKVEIGLFGPVADPTQPVSGTLPSSWQMATLASPNARITGWMGSLTAAATGDYRLYARAADRAGNQLPAGEWYLGNVWVTGRLAPMTAATVVLNPPNLANQTNLTLGGSLNVTAFAQHFRVFDGYAWRRLPPSNGAWSQQSVIPRSDLRSLKMLAVARDAFGNTAQAARTLAVDTVVLAPALTPSLPVGQWQTDVSPNLVVTWPAPVDGSGIANKWAVIDTSPTTSPTTPVAANQVARLLDQPGVYYAHLRVRDGAGNEAIAHSGPFPVNRTLTPSVNLPDGSIGEGEYPNGALLNYDPYAAFKPAALWGTWDAAKLYLGMSGHDWSENTPLALYFDTRAGGLSTSIPISGAHTLPFAADFAFLVGRPAVSGFSLYRASGASWLPVANPASFAVVGSDAEMVLDRAELQMTGAVGLVVMAEDADMVAPDGVWAVLPAASRPATGAYLSGPITLAGPGLTWPGGLTNGRLPNAGLTQVVAPEIVFNPEWDNALNSGRSASFQLIVRNPDIGPYANIPLSLQVDPLLALTGVQGATCQNCPANGNQWTLLANVGASSVQTLTVQARTMGQDFNGVKALSLQAGLANSGLPAQPQPPAHSQYFLDHGMTTVVPMKSSGGDIFTRPGAFELPILVAIDLDTALRCSSQVEVNPGGSGWQPFCQVGDCTVVVGNIPPGGSQTIQIRTTGLNGRSSTPVVRTIVADSTPPTTQIDAATVMSGAVAYLKGTAWDAFPTTKAPVRVEVSIDGKRYRPAILAASRNQVLAAGEEATMVAPWRFPLKLTTEDGKTIQVQARAIDEAGNVGPATRPMQIVLDNLGPKLTWELVEDRIQGTARDGSGVRSLEISLDGGVRYLPIPVNGVEWSFELSSWPGAASSVALLRADDVYGNESADLAPLPEATGVERVWLPRVER